MTRQYFDILDEQLIRCDELHALAESMGRGAHAMLVDRVRAEVASAVYGVDMTGGPDVNVYTRGTTLGEQEGVRKRNALLDAIEKGLDALPAFDVIDEDEDEDEDEVDELIRTAPED